MSEEEKRQARIIAAGIQEQKEEEAGTGCLILFILGMIMVALYVIGKICIHYHIGY
ncbi:MAG TPA: hypothetical protein H9875_00080 [Candidatus Levilactobacillus faecigallinarum]|uniref:Uncharacterized protein n=1 Tax=Candidatus Levilactobacillus faecigallinarum TaxID=2838638 RepID=A0A9D1QR00_9LACO|nr:hypothetical protein [Candidatus Levilactobacillus faecigallinarum]